MVLAERAEIAMAVFHNGSYLLVRMEKVKTCALLCKEFPCSDIFCLYSSMYLSNKSVQISK